MKWGISATRVVVSAAGVDCRLLGIEHGLLETLQGNVATGAILVERNNAGLVMIPLAVGMFLFGGGFFPPVFAMGTGLVGTRINGRHEWWRRRLPAGSGQLIGKVWRWSLGIGVTCWLSLFPGTVIAAYLFGADTVDAVAPNLVLWLVIPAFTFMLLSIFTGFANDSQRQGDLNGAPAMAK